MSTAIACKYCCLNFRGNTSQSLCWSPLRALGTYPRLGLKSFGLGSMYNITLLSIVSNVEPGDQAIGTACMYLFLALGNVVGVSLGSTIVQPGLRMQLVEKLGDHSGMGKFIEGVRKSLDFVKNSDPRTKDIVITCYRQATTWNFVFTAVMYGLGFLFSLWVKKLRLSE
jgi:hypothetical protein